MSDLVCDREFGIEIDGVGLRTVVEWFRPYRERGNWRCDWLIHWPHKDVLKGRAIGVDSTQALLESMGVVRAIIEAESPKVWWLEEGEDLHLPNLTKR